MQYIKKLFRELNGMPTKRTDKIVLGTIVIVCLVLALMSWFKWQ